MGLERIIGDFDARPPTYLIHFKRAFDVDISTPINCDNTELKRSSKINVSFSERHRWAVVGYSKVSVV